MGCKLINPDAWPEELREALEAMADALKEIVQKVKEFAELAVDRVEIERDIARMEWREAVLLAGQRAQARVLSYNRQMQEEKALRALRRRKRLHSDSGMPDW